MFMLNKNIWEKVLIFRVFLIVVDFPLYYINTPNISVNYCLRNIAWRNSLTWLLWVSLLIAIEENTKHFPVFLIPLSFRLEISVVMPRHFLSSVIKQLSSSFNYVLIKFLVSLILLFVPVHIKTFCPLI